MTAKRTDKSKAQGRGARKVAPVPAPAVVRSRRQKREKTPVEPLQSVAALTLNQQRFLTAFSQCGNVTREPRSCRGCPAACITSG